MPGTADPQWTSLISHPAWAATGTERLRLTKSLVSTHGSRTRPGRHSSCSASSPESGSCRSAYAGGGAHWPRSSICPARAQPWRDLGARPTAAMPPTPAPRSVAVRIRPGSSGQTINTPDKRQTQGVAPGHPAPVGVVHSSGTRCDETGQQAPAIMAGASHRCRHRHRPLPDRHPGRCPTWSATRAGALLSHSAVVPVVTTPVAERVDLIRSAGPGRSRRRRPSETPLFEALTTEWTAFGRIVPGQRDREWVELVTRRTWR